MLCAYTMLCTYTKDRALCLGGKLSVFKMIFQQHVHMVYILCYVHILYYVHILKTGRCV